MFLCTIFVSITVVNRKCGFVRNETPCMHDFALFGLKITFCVQQRYAYLMVKLFELMICKIFFENSSIFRRVPKMHANCNSFIKKILQTSRLWEWTMQNIFYSKSKDTGKS